MTAKIFRLGEPTLANNARPITPAVAVRGSLSGPISVSPRNRPDHGGIDRPFLHEDSP